MVFLNLPIYVPIFLRAMGNSFGPKTNIAIITIDKILTNQFEAF